MIATEYELPPHGYVPLPVSPSPMVHIFVSALAPVNVYLVDAENLARYQQGHPFQGHVIGSPVRFFSKLVQMPPGGGWHLVLENPSETSTHVQARATFP